MIISNILFSFLFIATANLAQATDGIDRGTVPLPGDTTKNYCLTEDQSVCASLLFQTKVDTKTAAKFVIRVYGSELHPANVAVDLWMRMGNGHEHGSSPVKMTQLSPDTLLIEDAYFIMGGEWLVRVKLTINGKLETIEIPVKVAW